MRQSLVLTVALIICLCAPSARAQSATAFEVGAQFSLIRLESVGPFVPGATEPGVGGRFAWLATPSIRVEAQLDVFPREGLGSAGHSSGLFGVVAGKRGAKAGLFGKARAGFVNYAQHPTLGTTTFRATNPAFEVGTVIERYATERLTLRFDVGGMFSHIDRIFAPVPPDVTVPRSTWRHNLQVTTGIGWRL